MAQVVVCGGGMAGLCAGLAAAEAGADVVVLEKGAAPGGSMRMSGGGIWTAPSLEVMERWAPGGDPVRKRQLVDGIADGLAWLEGHGVPRASTIANPRQTGMEVDPAAMTDALVAAITVRGGRVRTGTALVSLDRDDGRAVSAAAISAGGRRERVVGSVVLATGGFGGNRELVSRYISPRADSLLLRANPRSVGDGLLAALDVGARTSPNLATFYGHTMPAPPADAPPDRWTAVTAYYSQDAVLINERGERFMDESLSMADECAPAYIANQPGGVAAIVFDDRVYRNEGGDEQSPAVVPRQFDGAAAAGALHAETGTLEELAAAMLPWGISPVGFLATIAAFNEAVLAGRGAKLAVRRRGNHLPVVQAPFRAMLMRAGITFTLGGIDVDDRMRVLDRDGAAIPGLFAAGADAGGTYQGGYMGGLVLGLVQGRIAGRSAAERAASA